MSSWAEVGRSPRTPASSPKRLGICTGKGWDASGQSKILPEHSSKPKSEALCNLQSLELSQWWHPKSIPFELRQPAAAMTMTSHNNKIEKFSGLQIFSWLRLPNFNASPKNFRKLNIPSIPFVDTRTHDKVDG